MNSGILLLRKFQKSSHTMCSTQHELSLLNPAQNSGEHTDAQQAYEKVLSIANY